MTATISFHGALFDKTAPITPAIAKAANIASTYGLAIVRARTPIDTRLLKDSWRTKLEGNGVRYLNDAPYAGFVEHGTRKMAGRFMLADSLPDIANVFNSELAKEIGKELAADIIDSAANPGYGNSVITDNPGRFPGVGNAIQPKMPNGLTKRKYTKKYLFPNPNDIVRRGDKDYVNSSRPRYQKHNRPFDPEFK